MPENSSRRLAVVIPAYNAERTLSRCLDAIHGSSIKPDVVVVADDGSQDGTVRVAREASCDVVSLGGNSGPSKARNVGASRALNCEFLCFVDSDIVVEPEAISRMLEILQQKPEVAAVSGVYVPHPPGLGFFSLYKNLYTSYKWRLLQGPASVINSSIAMIRRRAFDEIGGYNERMRIAEDGDMGNRLAQRHGVWMESSVQASHLKEYGFVSLVKDTFHKGSRIAFYALRRRAEAQKKDAAKLQVFSFPFSELFGFVTGPAALAAALWVLASGGAHWPWLPALLAAYWLPRLPYIAYIAREGGLATALGALPYMIVESAVSAAALAKAISMMASEPPQAAAKPLALEGARR